MKNSKILPIVLIGLCASMGASAADNEKSDAVAKNSDIKNEQTLSVSISVIRPPIRPKMKSSTKDESLLLASDLFSFEGKESLTNDVIATRTSITPVLGHSI